MNVTLQKELQEWINKQWISMDRFVLFYLHVVSCIAPLHNSANYSIAVCNEVKQFQLQM